MKNSIHTFVVLAYKESSYLEDCIKSVLNQKYKSDVVIATSTPNSYINNLAKKYNLKVIVNDNPRGIGGDFDFAKNAAQTDLVTIAHQDDIYDDTYVEEIIKAYKNQPKSLIIFPDYYEIKHNKKVYKNTNLRIKRILLFPLRLHFWSNLKCIKRHALRLGCAISCPSVTFVNNNCPKKVFSVDLKCNIDWYAWEQLSRKKGYFYFINKPLMGHRIYSESTTSEVLKDNGRTIEDYKMLCKFWPKYIAKIITKLYANSEKSNNE